MTGAGAIDEWGEGIKCLRLPMPAFGGVNALIIGQRGSQAIIDTGLPNAATSAVWEQVGDDCVEGAQDILCTHMHIDHVGQAAPLLKRTNAKLWMNSTEHADAVRLSSSTQADRLIELQALWALNGFDASVARLPSDYSVLAPFPQDFISLRQDDEISLGGFDFRVLIGGGHSLAPACLFSPDRNILIAGDQLLPGSGPQIVVQSNDPEYDAMGAYLDFLDAMAALPADTMVLPGHGDPMPLGPTIAHIRQGHLARLDRLRAGITSYMSCAEMVPLVFSDRALARLGNRMPHIMPALANFLTLRGYLTCRKDESGVALYGPA